MILIYIYISSKHCCNIISLSFHPLKNSRPFPNLNSFESSLSFHFLPIKFFILVSNRKSRTNDPNVNNRSPHHLQHQHQQKLLSRRDIFSFFLFSLALCYVIHAWIRRMARVRACARVLPPILRTGRIGFADSPISRGDRPR